MKYTIIPTLALAALTPAAAFPINRNLAETCPSPQAAADVEGNCDFYPDCVEDLHGCSSEGYIMGYGHKYCSNFVANVDKFSPEGQAWILGTLTCLKNALIPVTDDPLSHDCKSLETLAFDSHVKCYMDNGFCELIFNLGQPLVLAEYVKDLLSVFELQDFASFIAIKQVWDILTQCPFHGTHDHMSDEGIELTTQNLKMVEAIVDCPESAATWSTDSTQLSEYRYPPITDRQGNDLYLGFKNEYEKACSSCGFQQEGNQVLYGYNFAWNGEVGTRAFWEDEKKGFNMDPAWWQNCPSPYVRKSGWWSRWGNDNCVLPVDAKFLGETCESKSQCANGIINKYVDVTCAPTNNDMSDKQLKCVFDEDANAVARSDATCSCPEGERYCTNNAECNGNTCVGAEFKCRWDWEITDLWKQHIPLTYPFLEGSTCSNCRNAKNACVTFDGVESYETDTSAVVVGGGMVGIGCVALIFGGIKAEKRRRQTMADAGLQMKSTSTNLV